MAVGVRLHPHCGSMPALYNHQAMTDPINFSAARSANRAVGTFPARAAHGASQWQGSQGSGRSARSARKMQLRNRLTTGFASASGAQSARFIFLAVWLCTIFALGGTSRPDTQSLLFLRPASVLVTAAGLWTLGIPHIARLRVTFAFVLAIVALIGLHLIPLPPSWWRALPGREIIVQVDEVVGLGNLWRPLSMSPPWTWNAFWFMFVPLSVLVHLAQLSTAMVRRLGGVILLIGLMSGLLAIAQVLGAPRGPLYPYRISHFGLAVGLFANRNHQAVFLATLVPIAMVWLRRNPVRITLDDRRGRQLGVTNALAILLVAALFPLVLASGSRAGLVALVISVVISFVVLSPFGRGAGKTAGKATREEAGGQGAGIKRAGAKGTGRARKHALIWTMIAMIGGLAVTGLALRNDRALSIERFIEVDPLEDMRTKILPTTFMMIRLYAPLGSGIGTFEPVYQIHEPDELLIPTYANHIHNDWLEVVMTAGVPGAVLLGGMVFAWGFVAWSCASQRRRRAMPDHDLAIASLVVVLLAGIASISDYPLRTPSFSALLTVMVIWAEIGLAKSHAINADKDNVIGADAAAIAL